ncbi:MAG: Trk system potassium transporter TrkA [Clostridia bacterium]|nr:Trk system potassium transporter TrkA [Clostridia bacterium]
MKIIIAGSGRVAEALVKQLVAEGDDLTVIANDAELISSFVEHYDVMAMAGNCASMRVLKEAGVEGADVLIAATGIDEVNLLCAMTAHGLNAKLHTIVRVRNPEYTEQIYAMRETFGISLVFNPEHYAAMEIERLLKYPGFLKRDFFAKGRVEIVELKLDASSKLCNLPLCDLGTVVKSRVLLCAVLRGDTALIPDGNFVLKEGDKIFVTAQTSELSKMLANLGITAHKTRNVLIAGCGTTGYYLAQALSKDKIGVTVIEKSMERCLELSDKLKNVSIICGDARNQELLSSEGLGEADALVTMTGHDELNVIVSMYGNACNVPQIITCLDRLDDSKIIDSLPLGNVGSPKTLFCDTIVRYLRAMKNQAGAATTIHYIAEGEIEALEFIIDENAMYCDIPLKDLKLKKNVLIACITSKGSIEIPGGNSVYRKGDIVIVVRACEDVILQFNDIFA